MIETESEARRYGISPENAGKILRVTSPYPVADKLHEILSKPDLPLIGMLQNEKLKLPVFIPPGTKEWGFGEVLQIEESSETNEASWICLLPQIGWSKEYDYNPFAVTTTLATLFRTLNFLSLSEENAPKENIKKQLVSIEMGVGIEMGRNSLHVTLGKDILPWLLSFKKETFHEGIQEIMSTAYRHIDSADPSKKGNVTSVWIQPPTWISLSCPGNSTGLDPENLRNPQEGYELSEHNLDSPQQQLTLLMGVAAMHQEADKFLANS